MDTRVTVEMDILDYTAKVILMNVKAILVNILLHAEMVSMDTRVTVKMDILDYTAKVTLTHVSHFSVKIMQPA